MLPPSLLAGENATFLDDAYRAWLRDPGSVDPSWQAMFRELHAESGARSGDVDEPPGPDTRSIFAGAPSAASPAAYGPLAERDGLRRAAIVQLINAWRVRGHFHANLDPLGRRITRTIPEMTAEHYGLIESDLDVPVPTAPLHGLGEVATIRQILTHLHAVYAGSIGAEFMNIDQLAQKLWVIEQLEEIPNRQQLQHEEELRFFRKLCDAETFERLLHTRFPGTKRFSLEGGETLVPLLDMVFTHAARAGVREVVMGMAHRGRLNALVNVLEKPVGWIVAEFQDAVGDTQGSGDVKYHLGYSSDLTTVDGLPIHLSLTPNPSHLEVVNAVVEGRVRAKQDRVGDDEHVLVMPVVLHGDAAFIGQGSVAETLQLSELDGYRTGGTVHVVVNNQIGFTTAPAEGRSTPYATDMARMLGVPILHVNGEDPRAVAACVRVAVAWRQRFHRDVVIDMYCYRKHGHNEGDEPSFTQPLDYELIRRMPSPRATYGARLLALGRVKASELEAITQASQSEMEAAAFPPNGERPATLRDPEGSASRERWQVHAEADPRHEVATGLDLDALKALLVKANTLPDGFAAHAKVKRLVGERLQMAAGERPIDWAVAEQAAFATLLAEGYPVRLTGQDTSRGTFSQRHAVWTDTTTGAEHHSLMHLAEIQGSFRVIDSNLSELAVLGFEYGYSLEMPDGLVAWEAQFGDFANGAQVVVDQFLSSSEQKWGRMSGLVMLLPHGYEGQGPEHSSARLERYLLQCAEDNMVVANCSTPANYFHILRRQVLRDARKPLVLMTPKSLLRAARCTSSLEALAHGVFQRVIADEREVEDVSAQRIIFCTGKVYYDLIEALEGKETARNVLLHRVEQLYPFPSADVRLLVDASPDAEVVWCQEEPANMGAWPVLRGWLEEALPASRPVRYVGRPAAASPATGSHHKHKDQQERLVHEALTLS